MRANTFLAAFWGYRQAYYDNRVTGVFAHGSDPLGKCHFLLGYGVWQMSHAPLIRVFLIPHFLRVFGGMTQMP
jgi:hypothetical protein